MARIRIIMENDHGQPLTMEVEHLYPLAWQLCAGDDQRLSGERAVGPTLEPRHRASMTATKYGQEQ